MVTSALTPPIPDSIDTIVPLSSFDGAVLEQAPIVESGNEIETIVEEVTSDGEVTLSFMTPVTAESLDGESAIRQLRGEDVFLVNDNEKDVETGVYTIYNMVDIQLSSKSVDDAEPVKVDWSMKDFNG